MSKPYAFVNERVHNYIDLRNNWLGIPYSARAKVDQLNPGLVNGTVMPGDVVVVGEGSLHMCTPEETELMQLAQDVRWSMMSTLPSEHAVMLRNYDMIQSIMSYGSIGIGAATGAWNKHLNEVESTLKEIEALHQRWRSGGLTNDQFFAERRKLFARMETHLKGIGRFGTGLNNRGKMKRILGISSKSYLHTGEIADYAKNVKGVSKVASAMSKGTYVGIALDVGAGALEIKEACSTGREEECRRAKFVETGKTGGGIVGSWAGGYAGASAGPAICIGLGAPSGGTITAACALVGIGLLAFGGGKVGSEIGDGSATILYEATHER